MRRYRFPLTARLTSILSLIAVVAATLALAAQDQGLREDLEDAARGRLERSARAADHLLSDALRDFALRHAGASRTPEFRAHLELGHRPTLERFAAELAARSHVSVVAFLDAKGRPVAGFGPAEARARLARAWRGEAPEGARRCIRPRPPREREPAGSAWIDCAPAAEGVQATLTGVGGEPWQSAVAPLRVGDRFLGLLVAGEPLERSALDAWSDLVGAELRLRSEAKAGSGELRRVVRRFGELALVAGSSLEREAAALARARRHLLGAGAAAVACSLIVSLLLARSFVRPIRRIQAAAERIGEGDLDVRLAIRRGDEIGDVAVAFDATLERLRRSQQRLLRVQRTARFGDWTLDWSTGTAQGSAEFRRLLGLPDAAGPHPLEALLAAIDPRDRGRLEEALKACRERDEALALEVRRPGPRGTRVLELRGRPAQQSGSSQLEASVHDVTERRRSEEQIRFLAHRDSLTGLGNRRLLLERLRLATARPDAPPFALIFVDLDRFKLVNDTLGHAAGDELLREVAARLEGALGAVEEALVARPGGDEFTALVPDDGAGEEAAATARAILEALGHPYCVERQEVVVTATLGVALWPEHGPAAENVMRACDVALHRAKAEGRNGVRFYDPSLQEHAQRRWRLESRLRAAFDEESLALYYQPRVEAQTSRIVGFEALLRWTDEELGLVATEDFVPLAEESGLILALGEWVIRTAFADLRAWRDRGLDLGRVSINLSGRQLRPGLVDEVERLLSHFGVDPSCVEFEVTESAVMDDEEVGCAALSALRDRGCRVSLDDFGTGFSSLSVLRRLPIDGLKIDRSFIRDIAREPSDAELTASIVAMGRILGLSVVAEGVESRLQRDLLREMGCDELQGFLFGEAVPPERAPELLRERRKRKRRR